MSVRKKCFGGRLGWEFKKKFPNIAAGVYIKGNFILRRKKTRDYIALFHSQKEIPHPLIVNIETVNRCNSTCDFCPANRNDDKRPYAKMSEEVFIKIIQDLKAWNYKGMISLYVNNEPLIDSRIIDFHKYVREQLPDCKIKFFTNGLLLNVNKFRELIPYIDYMTINNYGEDTRLHKNIQEVYNEIKTHVNDYKDKKIVINVRYIHDILTNRAGEAPNKKGSLTIIKEPCLFPYTDMTIFANGKVGICCNDATEKTNLGNVREDTVENIWKKEEGVCYSLIRKNICKGRDGWAFCRHCDTLDTGLRVKVSSELVH